MSDDHSAASKALVERFFAAGIFTPEGLSMVADDFEFIGPPSEGELFGGDRVLHGREGLASVIYTDKAVYDFTKPYEVNVHWMIAEGDIVVRSFDASFITHEGEQYHNEYIMVVRVRDGKIVEMRDYADTHLHHTITRGTPEKHAAVMDRLARLRAGEEI